MDRDTAAELYRKNQAALVDFLGIELDLAFTFLNTAHIDRDEPETVEKLVGQIRSAIETVRHFEDRIGDASTFQLMHARVDQLETALGSFSRSAA